MKIKEINLKAFGAFSDATIDLAGSNSGLQIVYGPNEAGKSTAMRAVYTSLFGFAHQSNDSARHSKPMVGATIESDGQTLSFLRRKGRKNTLLNPETNAALPDGTLKLFLGSVDAETFARVFSINVDELERGVAVAHQAGRAGLRGGRVDFRWPLAGNAGPVRRQGGGEAAGAGTGRAARP